MSKLSDILKGIDDRSLQAIPTPEWTELDGQLFAKRFSAAERAEFFEKWSKVPKTTLNIVAIACFGTVDSEGNPAFDAEDLDLLATKAAAPLERLTAKIDALNILTRAAEEGLEKN